MQRLASFRYIDDIFMTTNETVEVMKQLLEQAGCRDANIKINYNIDASVDFLDVTIINEEGRLRTAVYHKSAAEPYILPFTSDHPRHIHRNIPHAALLRAARLCSDVEDFDKECARLDTSLLLNDYPPSFITSQCDRFFRMNQATMIKDRHDRTDYIRLHQTKLNSSTRKELLLTKRLQDPIETPFVLEQRVWNSSIMYPNYTFDRAYTNRLHDRFHKWWNHFYRYPPSPVKNVTVYLTAKTNATIEQSLINKKPPKEILTLPHNTDEL